VKKQNREEGELMPCRSISKRKESSCCEERATEGGISLYRGCGQHGAFPGSHVGTEEGNGGCQKEGHLGHTT
jgi:hypothetical protein